MSYSFDTGNEGWRRGNLDLATLTLTDLGAAAWNARGYIEADDFSDYAFHLSADLGGLDLSAAYGGSISLYLATAYAGGTGGEPFVVLTNGSGAMYHCQTFAGSGNFAAYGYTLDSSSGWLYGTSAANIAPATEAQIRGILAGVTRVGVTADLNDGPDATRLDNLKISAVPEPPTILVLGASALALLRSRSR